MPFCWFCHEVAHIVRRPKDTGEMAKRPELCLDVSVRKIRIFILIDELEELAYRRDG